MGGSQGGLFMGAMLTQRPDLINAAVIQVPLFDMLRFHKLLAGASWMAEYGNPDIAEERAWIASFCDGAPGLAAVAAEYGFAEWARRLRPPLAELQRGRYPAGVIPRAARRISSRTAGSAVP